MPERRFLSTFFESPIVKRVHRQETKTGIPACLPPLQPRNGFAPTICSARANSRVKEVAFESAGCVFLEGDFNHFYCPDHWWSPRSVTFRVIDWRIISSISTAAWPPWPRHLCLRTVPLPHVLRHYRHRDRMLCVLLAPPRPCPSARQRSRATKRRHDLPQSLRSPQSECR